MCKPPSGCALKLGETEDGAQKMFNDMNMFFVFEDECRECGLTSDWVLIHTLGIQCMHTDDRNISFHNPHCKDAGCRCHGLSRQSVRERYR